MTNFLDNERAGCHSTEINASFIWQKLLQKFKTLANAFVNQPILGHCVAVFKLSTAENPSVSVAVLYYLDAQDSMLQ